MTRCNRPGGARLGADRLPQRHPGPRRRVRRARGGADAARLRGPQLRQRRRRSRICSRRAAAEAPHFGFAGHLDVVPPGEGWSGDPFVPEVRGGLLYGRGAVDMKGGIAAFVAAAAEVAEHRGTLSLLITGDEEGPAVHGTRAIMALDGRARHPARHDPDRRADLGGAARRHRQDRPARLGQHVDHDSRACRGMSPTRTGPTIRCRSWRGWSQALEALHLDDGSDAFQPSNLEVTAVETDTQGDQPHPGQRPDPAQHPLQRPSSRRGSRRPGAADGGGARRRGRASRR